MPCTASSEAHDLTEAGLLVLDGDIAASGRLVRFPDVVADLFVLSLLNSALVVLGSTAQELLLNEVDTLVKVVLVLLRLPAATSSRVQLIANATEEATAALLLLSRRGALDRLLASLLLLVIAAGELIDEIHFE